MIYNLGNPDTNEIPTYNPTLFELKPINPKLRPVMVAYIRARIKQTNQEHAKRWEQYKRIRQEYQKKVVAFESMVEQKMIEKIETVPKPDGRTSRRSGFRSDAVKTEQEWQNALSYLGIMPEKPNDDKVAKDVPMLARTDLVRDMKYVNNNDLVLDPEEDLRIFNQEMDVKWNENDRLLFRSKLVHHGKNFTKIASEFDRKSTTDCITYYYREKINQRFKNMLRRGQGSKRRKEKVQEVGKNPFRMICLDDDEEFVLQNRIVEDSTDSEGEHGTQVEPFQPLLEWDTEERKKVLQAFELYGHDFGSVSKLVETKNALQCKLFYQIHKREHVSKRKKKGKTGKKKEVVEVVEQSVMKQPMEEQVGDPMISSAVDDVEKRKELKKKRKRTLTGDEDPEIVSNQENLENALQTRRTVSYWSVAERSEFLKALAKAGRDWEQISKMLNTKSAIQVRNYFQNSRQKLKLDRILLDHGHLSGQEKEDVIQELQGMYSVM
jgi:peptidoglycan hydrolase-like protein with peptidoglycan-binding domain